jgi:hypothetical protein
MMSVYGETGTGTGLESACMGGIKTDLRLEGAILNGLDRWLSTFPYRKKGFCDKDNPFLSFLPVH